MSGAWRPFFVRDMWGGFVLIGGCYISSVDGALAEAGASGVKAGQKT